MNKTLTKLLALLLTVAMLAGIAPAALAEGDEDICTLTNDYIKVDVNKSNGGFHIDTVLGNKLEKDDDNKLLLHNSGDYDTSFTSVRITRGGVESDYIFGRDYTYLGKGGKDVTTTATESRITSTWTVDSVTITQNIELANSASRENGMVIITYSAVNLGDKADVKLRVMLDTALGYQDYAYYSIPKSGGGFEVIERETVLEGNQVYDSMMFGSDDKFQPRITAYTVNATVENQACVPYKVAFGHWNNLASTVFDFEPNPEMTFTNEYNVQYLTADSAYALYYDMGELAPNAKGTVATNYGVYSNAGVVQDEKTAINIAGANPMRLDESKEHYLSSNNEQDKLSLTVTLNNFTDEDLHDVWVYVYAEDDIRVTGSDGQPATNEDGSAPSELDPYVFSYDSFPKDSTQQKKLEFTLTPSPTASYRKVEIVSYLHREGMAEVRDEDVIGRQSAYILCPGTVGGIPEVVITGCTEHIYNQGKQRISVSGIHFSMLEYTGAYKFKLARITRDGYDVTYEVPADNVTVDTETNTVELLLPAAVDDEERVIPRPLGTYQLIIDYVDENEQDVVSSAAKIIMSDDIRYSTMGYGILAVVETEAEEEDQTTHRVETFDDEEGYKDFKEKLDDSDEILMVLKGDFSDERDYGELENGEHGQYWQAEVIVSNNVAQNPVTVNDSLELRSGYIRVIHDYGDDGVDDTVSEDGTFDDQILVDVDGNMRIAGTGTLVYNGVAAFTAIENGTDYILRPYDQNGERLTSELEDAEGDANDDSEDLNTITYIFSKVFDSFVSVANIVNVDFTFGELGMMYNTDEEDESGNPTEMTMLVSFGAALDLSMLVPNGTRESDAGTNDPNAAGGAQQGGNQGQGGGTSGGGTGSGTGSGSGTGTGTGTGTGSGQQSSSGGDGKFVSEWRNFTTKLKEATTNARNIRANWAQYQAARRAAAANRPNSNPTGSGNNNGAPSSSHSGTSGVGDVTTQSGAGSTATPGAATTGDSREIGKYPTGAAEVQDILYGGGQFIGLHFSVDVGVPPLTTAMPSIQGTLEVNTIGDWRFSVDGGLEFAKFSLQASIEIIYNQEKGIPVPNKLYMFLEVPPPGVNVDGFGIVWFRGAGGGIDNLYETIFTPSTLPSVSILLSLSGSLIQLLYMKANLEASLSGFSLMAETVQLGETNIEVLHDSGISLQWIPGFKFTANVHVDFLEILKGAGYIVIDYPNDTYEFYAQVGVTIPDAIPLIGGLEVGNAGVGINQERIWGKIKLIGLGFGIVYYWGGSFSFNKGEGEAFEPSYPELLSAPIEGPVIFDESSGRTLYAAVAPTFTRSAKATVVANFDSNSGIMMADAAPGASKLISNIAKTEHKLQFASDYANKSGALNIAFVANSYDEAKELAKGITVQCGDTSKTVILLEDDLSNEDTANAALSWPSKTNEDGTLVLQDGKPVPAEGPQTARVVISFTDDAELVSSKVWVISTKAPSDLELYDVADLPEFTFENAVINDNNTLTVTWDKAAANGSLQKLAVYATTSDDPASAEAPVTLIGILDPEAEGLSGEEKERIQNELKSGSATLKIPADLASGSYSIKVNATLSETLLDTVVSANKVTFTNPNQPNKPTISKVENAGDYRLRVTEGSTDNFDAYQVNVYEKVDGTTWKEVSDCSGVTFAKGQDLVVGGRYEVDQDADTHDVYEGEIGGDEDLPAEIGLEGGKTYRVGVRKINYLYYNDTALEDMIPDNAMGAVMTDEVFSDEIVLNTPKDVSVNVSAKTSTGKGPINVDVATFTGVETENGVSSYTATVPTFANQDVTVSVHGSEPVKGIWYMDSTSYSAAVLNAQEEGAPKLYGQFDLAQDFTIDLTGLETQEHTLVLVGTNAQGDAFTEHYTFAVDTLAPVLRVIAPTSGSFTDKSDQILVSGLTDPGAKITVSTNGGAGTAIYADENGLFSQKFPADGKIMKNTVRITASDEADNTMERVYSVYNYRVNDMESLQIRKGGQDITGKQLDTGSAIESGELTLWGVPTGGSEQAFLINDESQVEWMLFPAEGKSELDGSLFSADKYSQGMVTATLSMTDESATVPEEGDIASGGTGEPVALTDADASFMSAAFCFGLDTSTVEAYRITCSVDEAGEGTPVSIAPNTDTARASDEITVTVTKGSGYDVSLTSNVDGLEISKDESKSTESMNVYTFTMPAQNVHLTASLIATTQYEITVESDENGDLTLEPESAFFGETVTVTPNPGTGYTLDELTVETASGGKITVTPGEDGSYTFVMPNGPVTVKATFKPIDYTVTAGTTEHGSVTADPTTAHYGDTVTVTATPDTGYKIGVVTVTRSDNGETVDVTGGEDGSYTFTMPASDVTVSAVFGMYDYTVVIGTYVNGAVSTDTPSVNMGDIVTLTVTPDVGYTLDELTVETLTGETVSLTPGEDGKYTFTMPASDVTVKATFKPIDYTVTAGTADHGGVTANHTTAHYGDTVTVTAKPDTGYKTGAVTVTRGDNDETVDVTRGEDGSYTFIMPASDVTVSAVFGMYDYTVSSGTYVNDAVSVDTPSVNMGDTVILTVTPDVGYTLDALTVETSTGETVDLTPGEDGKYTFTMPASDVTVKATFKPIDYTVTAGTADHGGVTTDPATAHYGDTVTVTVTPDAGYTLRGLTVTTDGGESVNVAPGETEGTYTFTMPADNVSITPEFQVENGRVQIEFGESEVTPGVGDVTVTPENPAPGESVTVTVADKDGYYSDVTVETVGGTAVDVTVDENGSYTFTMPEDKVTVTVTYCKILFELECSDLEDVFDSYPDAIKAKYTDADGMRTALVASVRESGVDGENTVVYDIKLMMLTVTSDGHRIYEEVTAEDFPESGVTVTLAYPEAVADTWEDYDFTLLHLIIDPLDTGKKAGDIEKMDIETTENGIVFTADCLSPFILGWTEKEDDTPEPTPDDEYYSVQIPSNIPGGSVKANRPGTTSGQKVTLTVTPDFLQRVKSVEIFDGSGKKVNCTENPNGTYSFLMPYSDVRVDVEFEHVCPSFDFPDLDPDAWYHTFTDYVIYYDLMHGVSGGLFAPDGTLTRAEMVMVLWNLEKNPTVDYLLDFSDVHDGDWYTEAIRWAASEGIVDGYDDGCFGPNDNVTREQMATMLYRYEQKLGNGGFTGDWAFQLPFDDASKVSGLAYEAVAWCNMSGVINGKDGNIFDPAGKAKRSELAAVITRYLELDEEAK